MSTLSLSGNQVKEISSITNLNRLYYLFLENNKVKSLGPWPVMTAEATNEFLPFLNLYVKGNPLDRASKKKLDQLQEIGVKVNR